MNHVAYEDTALANVFINSHIVNNTLTMICLILIWSVKTLSMRRIKTGVHGVHVKSNALLMYPYLNKSRVGQGNNRKIQTSNQPTITLF